MLPDGDGFSFMKELRKWSNIPVLFLFAKDEDQSRLTGLGPGADDYITKPFLPEELILRLTAVLKRTYFPLSAAKAESKVLVLGNKTVNFESGLAEWKRWQRFPDDQGTGHIKKACCALSAAMYLRSFS